MKTISAILSAAVLLAACGQKQIETAQNLAMGDSNAVNTVIDSPLVKKDSVAVVDSPAVKKNTHKAYTIDMGKKETPADKTEPKKVENKRKTVYGKWVLESLNGKKATKDTYKNGIPFINIDGAKHTITGFSGCNNMNGECEIVEGSKFKIGGLISTKMFCEGVPENELFALLRGTHEFATTGDKLMINEGGAVKAVFFRPYE